MQIYPEDILKAVQETRAKAEASKQAVQPPAPNPDYLAKKWESVRAARQK